MRSGGGGQVAVIVIAKIRWEAKNERWIKGKEDGAEEEGS